MVSRGVAGTVWVWEGPSGRWVVDLEHGWLLAYRALAGEHYQVVQTFRRRETLSPLAFADRPVAVDDILP